MTTSEAPGDGTETFVKFNGASASVESPDIALGDVVKFSGMGECVRVATEKRSDGERRPVITVKVGDVELAGVIKAPKEDHLPFGEDAPALGADS